ncbi:UNVERIFIED_CONTAM: hypothetical protein HDU68_006820 [Siphonaria sp. JEL0065]|nr:hypothetical protein HDU68_006820 [Siphonaria sp. JEL0065]
MSSSDSNHRYLQDGGNHALVQHQQQQSHFNALLQQNNSSATPPDSSSSYFFHQSLSTQSPSSMINIPQQSPLGTPTYYQPAQRHYQFNNNTGGSSSSAMYVERVVHQNGDPAMLVGTQSPLVQYGSFAGTAASQHHQQYFQGGDARRDSLQMLHQQQQISDSMSPPPNNDGSPSYWPTTVPTKTFNTTRSVSPNQQQQQQQQPQQQHQRPTKRGPPNSVLANLPSLTLNEIDPTLLKKLSKSEKKKIREHNRGLVCFNCGATTSPIWRRSECKEHMLCNACGLYWKHNQSHRPLKQKKVHVVTKKRKAGVAAKVEKETERTQRHEEAQEMGQGEQQQANIVVSDSLDFLSEQGQATILSSNSNSINSESYPDLNFAPATSFELMYSSVLGSSTGQASSQFDLFQPQQLEQQPVFHQNHQEQQQNLGFSLDTTVQQNQVLQQNQILPQFSNVQQQISTQLQMQRQQHQQILQKQLRRAQRLMGQGGFNSAGGMEDSFWDNILSSNSNNTTRSQDSFGYVDPSYNLDDRRGDCIVGDDTRGKVKHENESFSESEAKDLRFFSFQNHSSPPVRLHHQGDLRLSSSRMYTTANDTQQMQAHPASSGQTSSQPPVQYTMGTALPAPLSFNYPVPLSYASASANANGSSQGDLSYASYQAQTQTQTQARDEYRAPQPFEYSTVQHHHHHHPYQRQQDYSQQQQQPQHTHIQPQLLQPMAAGTPASPITNQQQPQQTQQQTQQQPPAQPRRRRISSGKALEQQQQMYLQMDPQQLKQLSKAERKKLREHNRNLTCFNCGATSTPLWRRTADRKNNLCNACGLYYKQYQTNRPVKNISVVTQPDVGVAAVASVQAPGSDIPLLYNPPSRVDQPQPQQQQQQTQHHSQQPYSYLAAAQPSPYTSTSAYSTGGSANNLPFMPTNAASNSLPYGTASAPVANVLNPLSYPYPQPNATTSSYVFAGQNTNQQQHQQMPPFSTMTNSNNSNSSDASTLSHSTLSHSLIPPPIFTNTTDNNSTSKYTDPTVQAIRYESNLSKPPVSPAIDPALESQFWASNPVNSMLSATTTFKSEPYQNQSEGSPQNKGLSPQQLSTSFDTNQQQQYRQSPAHHYHHQPQQQQQAEENISHSA